MSLDFLIFHRPETGLPMAKTEGARIRLDEGGDALFPEGADFTKTLGEARALLAAAERPSGLEKGADKAASGAVKTGQDADKAAPGAGSGYLPVSFTDEAALLADESGPDGQTAKNILELQLVERSAPAETGALPAGQGQFAFERAASRNDHAAPAQDHFAIHMRSDAEVKTGLETAKSGLAGQAADHVGGAEDDEAGDIDQTPRSGLRAVLEGGAGQSDERRPAHARADDARARLEDHVSRDAPPRPEAPSRPAAAPPLRAEQAGAEPDAEPAPPQAEPSPAAGSAEQSGPAEQPAADAEESAAKPPPAPAAPEAVSTPPAAPVEASGAPESASRQDEHARQMRPAIIPEPGQGAGNAPQPVPPASPSASDGQTPPARAGVDAPQPSAPPSPDTDKAAETGKSAPAGAEQAAKHAAKHAAPRAGEPAGESLAREFARQREGQAPGRSADAPSTRTEQASGPSVQAPSLPDQASGQARAFTPAQSDMLAHMLRESGLHGRMQAPGLNLTQAAQAAQAADAEQETETAMRTELRADAARSLQAGAQPSQSAAARFAPHTVQTLAAQIARRSADGARIFDIRMDPPELGRVSVRLEMNADNSVRAFVSAERAETLAELQRTARELERALDEAGLDLADNGLDFSMSRDAQEDDGGGARTPDAYAPAETLMMTSGLHTDGPLQAANLYGFALNPGAGLDLTA